MSAWPQAAWIVNQIKIDNQQNYEGQITNLATSVATWQADMKSDYEKKFSAIVASEIPDSSDNDNFSNGSLCFITA